MEETLFPVTLPDNNLSLRGIKAEAGGMKMEVGPEVEAMKECC